MAAPWAYSDKQPCGTSAAYKRHLRNGESPCRPCRQAEARRWADSRAAAKRRKVVAAGLDPVGPAARVDVAYALSTVSQFLLDICEAMEGPPPEWRRERDEWGAA